MVELRDGPDAEHHRRPVLRDGLLTDAGRLRQITQVGEADLADLLPLLRAYCAFYAAAPADQALLALARACLDDPQNTGVQLLARDHHGAPIGFATVFWTWSTSRAAPIALMNDLFVINPARRTGTGRALIDACAALASDRGVTVLEWQTAPDNHRAQRIYDSTPAERTTWLTYEWDLEAHPAAGPPSGRS